jgi:threonylcarbamoyladenosine tRNA methylthiotransferase MtaB
LPSTVAFRTLGCKLNQCETAQMEQALLRRGYRLVSWQEPADVRVLNTCTVTAKTDRECRHEVSRAKRRDPTSRMAVTGCYAQVASDKVAAIPGVELVLGNLDKMALADHLDSLLGSSGNGCVARTEVTTYRQPCETPGGRAGDISGYSGARPAESFEGDFITHFAGYTRAFLKVQNGCDARCSYCVIPTARGPSRSMSLAGVQHQLRLLGEQGYAEVVLTGIHLGAWGRDTGEGGLADLLAGALEVQEVARLRLSSTEPMEITDRVLAVAAAAGERFAAHLHVPLQSGSDAVLRRMNRPYRRPQYAERVRAIRSWFPTGAIGADVIVGFPGETDAEFDETLEFVASLPLTYLHVFAYSDRPGTRASSMPAKVAPETIKARSERLRALGREKNSLFQESFREKVLTALLLRQRSEDGDIVGLTGNYVELVVPGDDSLMNHYAPVRLVEPTDGGRWRAVLAGEPGPRP